MVSYYWQENYISDKEEQTMTKTTKIIIAITAALSIAAAATIIILNRRSDADLLNDKLMQTSEIIHEITETEDTPVVTISSHISEGEPISVEETAESAPIPDSPTTSERPADTATTPASTTNPADTTKPAVTIVTSKPTDNTPDEPVRTDLPKVTAAPEHTGTATTTDRNPSDEPVEKPTDENGFPKNPNSGDTYTDSNGTTWVYNGIFQLWSESGPVIVDEIPDFELSGEKWTN